MRLGVLLGCFRLVCSMPLGDSASRLAPIDHVMHTGIMSANRRTEKAFLEELAEAGADVSATPKIGDTVSRKTARGSYRAGEFVSLDHVQNLGVFK